MNYLIYGTQIASIKTREGKVVNSILDTKDDLNYVKIDATLVTVQEIVDECSYIPLGYDKKVVSVSNCYFLSKSKEKNKIDKEQDFKKLFKYINNPNPSCDLILCIETDSIDSNGEIYKKINEIGKIYKINEPTKEELSVYISRYFNEKLGVSISKEAVKELALRIDGDLTSFQNNAKKLALYSSNITYDDVCLMVARPLEENAYLIFNHLLNKRNDLALKVYRDLRVNNVEPISLISNLANQFRLLHEVMYLSKNKLSSNEIATQLNINPYRAEILKKNSYTLSESRIRNILEDLYNLDYNIKSGLVDRLYAFELFIINFKVY
ncbi:MAG: DNA polymerase III subunit delta [Bacilli bacterium]